MTKHRSLVYGATIPQDWLDNIQELISTLISENAQVSVLNTNTVQIPAGTDNSQVTLGINGRWRFNTAAVNATHPGGAAGTYNLWATAADNNFAIGPPEVDSTVYSFAIQILAVGSTPATALFRQIGTVQWNGTAITDANLITDDPVVHGTFMPGDLIYTVVASRAGALLCDGSSYLRTTYPALFNALGGAASPYGFADGTHFNVPDLRGRTIIGVGTGAGLTARALAAQGGEETHLTTSAESGTVAHQHPSGATVTGSTATGSTGTGTTGTGTTGTGTATPASNPVNSGGASARHTHPNGLASAGVAIDATAGTTYGMVQIGSTGNDTPDHSHSVTLPTYAVPGLTVPGLSVPALSIPGLALTGAATGIIPAAVAANAASAHNNMQPWSAAYIHIKI